MIHLAFNAARERAGCKGDASAFVKICEAFLDDQLVGGVDFGSGSALAGANTGNCQSEETQDQHGCIPTTGNRLPSASVLHSPHRRSEHSPASAYRIERTGELNSPGEPVQFVGGGEAIFTRAAAKIGPARDAAKLGIQLVGPFPKFPSNSVKAFARRLGLKENENWLNALSREAEDRYQQHYERKRSGGQRLINKPDVILKAVQKLILRRVFDRIPCSSIAYAVKGRSYVDAATLHARQPWVANDDIAAFFPSVTTEVARELFSQMGCEPELAEMLAGLLTYRGALPQGAPTSPAVANFLLYPVDLLVQQAAVKNGCNVSRYVDDFTYSGPKRPAIEAIREVAKKEIRAIGFDFNPKKKRTTPRHRPQHVHGLTVNNGACVPKRKAEKGRLSRKKLKSEARRVARYGCSEKERGKLLGQIRSIAPLHRREALKLEKQLE